MGGARASGQVRLRHQRRHRALAGGRRPAGAPAHRGVAGDGEDPRHHHPGARHPRRRAGAHAGEPPHDHAAHSRLEGRHRDRPSPERLSSRPPGRRSARSGRLLHGDGAVLLPGHASPGAQPGLPVLSRTTSRGPNPFRADIVVAIDDVLEKKLAAVEALPSQFYEGGANGGPQLVPSDEAGKARRKNEVRESFKTTLHRHRTQYRAKLRELYGESVATRVQYAEAFEISEYGRRPNAEEIRRPVSVLHRREVNEQRHRVRDGRLQRPLRRRRDARSRAWI